jgi:Putative beta-barrel porin-2, OmpL-like. bbp2
MMTSKCLNFRACAPVILALACGTMCSAQTTPESKGMGQMTGRDDSGADRKTYTLGTYPEDQRPLLDSGAVSDWGQTHKLRSFGWLDGGFTSVSNASGLVAEAPTPNRFSNQFMLNAAWLVLERSTTKNLSWGFRTDFYAGSDAALLRSQNHFGPDGARWGTEFRQAYFKLHTPFLFREGIDWTAGKINIPTGVETTLSPYNQLYSRGYFWTHDGSSGTALFATAHTSPQTDVVLGTTMGYNTSFILRGRAPSYLAKIIYHPTTERKQQYLATVYTGPKPLAAAANHVGSWQTLAELQAREVWTPRFNQAFDVGYFSDPHDPANGRHNSGSQDAFVLTSYELNRIVALHTRLEWFADPHGARAAVPGTYGEATAGITLHPTPWFEFRPEIRGDFSGQHSFGSEDSPIRHRNELSAGFELLLKGRIF